MFNRMKNKKKILSDLKLSLIKVFGNNIKDVILFGSQAYGDEKPDSDYDILIILKEKADWKYRRLISDICYEVELKYDIIIDSHILTETELSTIRGKQPIFVNAINNGIYA